MSKPRNGCAKGKHNWGDLSPYLDSCAYSASRGLTVQTVTFICDSCDLRLVFKSDEAVKELVTTAFYMSPPEAAS